jgi:hypothetical protein
MDRKTRKQALASDIRRGDNVHARAIKELLSLHLEEVKDSLIASEGAQMLRLQGEAQILARLLSMLTKEPPSIIKGDNL